MYNVIRVLRIEWKLKFLFSSNIPEISMNLNAPHLFPS